MSSSTCGSCWFLFSVWCISYVWCLLEPSSWNHPYRDLATFMFPAYASPCLACPVPPLPNYWDSLLLDTLSVSALHPACSLLTTLATVWLQSQLTSLVACCHLLFLTLRVYSLLACSKARALNILWLQWGAKSSSQPEAPSWSFCPDFLVSFSQDSLSLQHAFQHLHLCHIPPLLVLPSLSPWCWLFTLFPSLSYQSPALPRQVFQVPFHISLKVSSAPPIPNGV